VFFVRLFAARLGSLSAVLLLELSWCSRQLQETCVAINTAAAAVAAMCALQVPAYVIHRLARVREAGSNQAERKRRARLLALLAALIRVSRPQYCLAQAHRVDWTAWHCILHPL
jgi:hypothetical protein